MPTIDCTGDSGPEGLTSFQVEVARVFFALPASTGFLLAGGAALLAQRLTTRPTQDLDFFTSQGYGDVTAAVAAFASAATVRGWMVRRVRESSTFARLVVDGPEQVLIDIAVDSPPSRPPTASIAGPTFDPEELAGRKVIALFDRAEARDFADVHTLVGRFGKALLLDRAAEVDLGFDRRVFADMLRTLHRFDDAEIPVPADTTPAVRAFYADWADELESERPRRSR